MREYLQYPCGRHERQQRQHRKFGFQRGDFSGVVRYTSTGSVNTAFGRAGGATNSFTPQKPQVAPFAQALQLNGNIVAVVTSLADNKTGGLVVARHLGQ